MAKKPYRILQIPGWITAPQAAEKMGVSLDYISRLVSLELLPLPVYIGDTSGCRMFKEVDIQQYIDAHPNLGARRKVAAATA